jgi:hypothetical protein
LIAEQRRQLAQKSDEIARLKALLADATGSEK